MRRLEIEAWTLRVIDRVKNGQPPEDDATELKAEWIPHHKAARRIAGHANAAGNEPILWLVGIDESKGAACVVGATANDLSTWWPQVLALFDGPAPHLTSVVVSVDGTAVMALLFDTDGAPFVVKNPLFGTQPGHLEREVPWRSGTALRTAKREDLVRILVPLVRQPDVEVLGGGVIAQVRTESSSGGGRSQWLWIVRIGMYVVPRGSQSITIPFHHCALALFCGGILLTPSSGLVALTPLSEASVRRWETGGRFLPRLPTGSPSVNGGSTEVVVSGPGTVQLASEWRSERMPLESVTKLEARVAFRPLGTATPVRLSYELSRTPPEEAENYAWQAEATHTEVEAH